MIRQADKSKSMPQGGAYGSDIVLTAKEMIGIGLKISPGSLSTNFGEWCLCNKIKDGDNPDGYLAERLGDYFRYCSNHPALRDSNDKIRGEELEKIHVHYSRNGNPEGSYSVGAIKKEQDKNCELIIAAITYKSSSIMGIDVVWEQFFVTPDDHYRNRLMEHYRPLVKCTAERLHAGLPDQVELDDLISAGTFGLMDAINDYDPTRDVKFETYCTPRIRGSMLDELRCMDWVPRLVRARAHQLSRATRSLEMRLGCKPTEQETAEELDMGREDFNRLRRDANAAGLISLDYCGHDSDDGEKHLSEKDLIADKKSVNPLVELQKKYLKNLLTHGLTRAEQLVIILYYYEEMTMKEIGRTLDLNESRVSQLHSSILAKLKAKMYGQEEEMLGRRMVKRHCIPEYTALPVFIQDFIRRFNMYNETKIGYQYIRDRIDNDPMAMELLRLFNNGFEVHSRNFEALMKKANTYALEHIKEEDPQYLVLTPFIRRASSETGLSIYSIKNILSKKHKSIQNLIEPNPDRKGSFMICLSNVEALIEKIKRFAG